MADVPKGTEMLGSHVVVGLVILMNEDGEFGCYLSVPGMEVPPEGYPYSMPTRDTLDAITRMLAFEWAADTLEGKTV